MSNIIIDYIGYILVICWSAGGVMFYISNCDEITSRTKKLIARIVAGPLVWSLLILSYILQSIGWIDNVYVTFCHWLKKP